MFSLLAPGNPIRLGFEEEGRMRDCFYGDDGRYRDIIMMGVILDGARATVEQAN